MQEAPRTIAVVGPGRLGRTLAAALERAGYRVATAGRDELQDAADTADLIFLTVPDSAIAEVAASVRWRPGQWVVHCSGALGRDALAAAEAAGAVTGCFHPLQTFPSRMPEPDRFAGIACGIEAPEPLAGFLERLAKDLGTRPFRLEGVDRALYHAAAVVASNHVVALASAASRLWELAGVRGVGGREALSPLTNAAAQNVASMELTDALPGPVGRGDAATVARHLDALNADAELREFYRRLSLELLRITPRLDDERRESLRRLLSEP